MALGHESLEEILSNLQDAGLVNHYWSKSKKDWVPYYTAFGAAMARFMETHGTFPSSNADNDEVKKWWKVYEDQDAKSCPKCGSSHFWPTADSTKEQYFNHWCEDCDYTLEEKK